MVFGVKTSFSARSRRVLGWNRSSVSKLANAWDVVKMLRNWPAAFLNRLTRNSMTAPESAKQFGRGHPIRILLPFWTNPGGSLHIENDCYRTVSLD